MTSAKARPASIDEYIAGFPADLQAVLQKIRQTITKAAPGAAETIKYGMPTFTLKGNLVYFAAYKRHIAVYPIPGGDETFQARVAPYRTEKSTLRLPLTRPIPYDLIEELVRFRVQEQQA